MVATEEAVAWARGLDGVFLGYASRHGHALIDRALYLPEVWANDPARRGAAGVVETTVFATKPQLGRQMNWGGR